MNKAEFWLLVRWLGSVPEMAFDIVSVSEIEFEDETDIEDLSIDSLVMVKFGRIKSPAYVQKISDKKHILEEELEIIKRLSLTDPIVNSKKRQRTNSPPPYYKDADTQTDFEPVSFPLEDELKNEIVQLKAELCETKRLINSICSDLKVIVNKTEDVAPPSPTNIKSEDETSTTTSQEEHPNYPIVELKNKVLIGSNRTPVPRRIYTQINWLSYKNATSKLLTAVFTREVLATHSLTGKPSPAFLTCGMPAKTKLDPVKVADIVDVVSKRCSIPESVVRNAITTKCADENKMLKKRSLKNKENVPN